ncbi:MAG: zinc ribbon domain-containing protein [Elusimicrobia bacterium]|nr:zinc ribbon domain-containing protein [Elusimicrobiota bacterium]
MRACLRCRSENDDDSGFCDQCGAKLPPRNSAPGPEEAPAEDCCPDCGGEVRQTSGTEGVCAQCGAKLRIEDDGEPDAAQVPEPSGGPIVVFASSSAPTAYAEAALVLSQLKAAGFACEMLDAQQASMGMVMGGVNTGVRVVVPQSQAEDAREFLHNRGRTKPLGPLE